MPFLFFFYIHLFWMILGALLIIAIFLIFMVLILFVNDLRVIVAIDGWIRVITFMIVHRIMSTRVPMSIIGVQFIPDMCTISFTHTILKCPTHEQYRWAKLIEFHWRNRTETNLDTFKWHHIKEKQWPTTGYRPKIFLGSTLLNICKLIDCRA